MNKTIEFDELIEICKFRSDCGEYCSEDDNLSGACDNEECPFWHELKTI